MSRILGVLCGLAALLCVVLSIDAFTTDVEYSGKIGIFFLGLALVLGVMCGTGWKHSDIGFKRQVTLFGSMLRITVGDGWRWVPLPFFTTKPTDCRPTPVTLDPLNNIYSSDRLAFNVPELSADVEIIDLYDYLNTNPTQLKKMYDDVVDKTIKQVVARDESTVVVNKSYSTEDIRTGHNLDRYGLRINQIVAPTVTAADEAVKADIELRGKEGLEMTGQIFQGRTLKMAAAYLQTEETFELDMADGTKKIVLFKGFEEKEAHELAQLITEKATKAIHTLAVDATLGKLAEFLKDKVKQ